MLAIEKIQSEVKLKKTTAATGLDRAGRKEDRETEKDKERERCDM